MNLLMSIFHQIVVEFPNPFLLSLFLTLFNPQGCSFKSLHALIKKIMKYIRMYMMVFWGNFHLQSGMAIFMNAKNLI